MADDPLAEMVAAWRRATDAYIAAWTRAVEAGSESETGKAAIHESRKTYLGSQATLDTMTRELAEPMLALAGGVPMSEFRRLADQVQTVLMRLDRIDDALRALRNERASVPSATSDVP